MSQEQYDQEPATLTVRELHCGGKIMVTTLLNARQTTKADIKQLYRSRWHVELDIRNLKSTLGLDILSCKTPDMVIKEIWVYLLAHNLIRLLMAQSALLGDCLPRQLSFKHALQLWGAWRQYHDENDEEQMTSFLLLIAERRVADRPGRIEPRAVKRRPKPHPLLTQSRSKARRKIVEEGHPKKTK